MNATLLVFVAFALATPAMGADYFVDQAAVNASDDNPGTEAEPWQTISRASGAAELAPGDSVIIKAGVYREDVGITVSGQEGAPITFASAPGHRVVLKGSERVVGPWQRVSEDPAMTEPFPNAFSGVWKITLGDEMFTDPRFAKSYEDKSRRWVSQVILNDTRTLQRIGEPVIYRNEGYPRIAFVGRSLADITDESFFFDPADQSLYMKIGGNPAWYSIEVGVRGFVLTAREVHDVVVRGLEVRHNRQPGGQWPMASLGACERVTIEGCTFEQADFCGLGMSGCKACVVRDCDLSYNGNTGLGLSKSEDCLIEDCRLLFNNYRRFRSSWHAGGMKCIPDNTRCTVRRCEAAYNIASDGIWFDAGNSDIRILDNVSHHNGGCGIFFEINKGGGLIAGNLSYANQGRGIYISGSQNTQVVHNTVACNGAGIVAMPRGEDWPLENVWVMNNLMIANYTTASDFTRGCDLTVYMGAQPDTYERTVLSNHSDYNVYAGGAWSPTMRHHWNPDNTLDQWRDRFGEDMHSVAIPVQFQRKGTGFALPARDGLDIGGPLPEGITWRPASPGRVGSDIARWP